MNTFDRELPPQNYRLFQQRHPRISNALEALGKVVHEECSLEPKVAQLIQLAAAVSIRSEGAVHSHARRALEAGASAEEIRQCIVLLISTVGYPTVAAALSWVDDLLGPV